MLFLLLLIFLVVVVAVDLAAAVVVMLAVPSSHLPHTSNPSLLALPLSATEKRLRYIVVAQDPSSLQEKEALAHWFQSLSAVFCSHNLGA